MKNSKFLRSALIALLCLAILGGVTGGTIAWFTDTVEVTNNVIKSGNLDIAVQYKLNAEDEWADVEEDTQLFGKGLWEPGHVEAAALRIVNKGNLALKYDYAINVISETASTNVYGETFELSDSLEALCHGPQNGDVIGDILINQHVLSSRDKALGANTAPVELAFDTYSTATELAPGAAHVLGLVIHMPTTVGNEANHMTGAVTPEVVFGIVVRATQYTYEDDSFDNQYDKDATFPEVDLTNAPEAKMEDIAASNLPKDVAVYKIWPSYGTTDEVVDVDKGYVFTALQTPEEAATHQYADWHADFVVTVNDDMAANTCGLAGQYDSWSSEWLAFHLPKDAVAGESFRLLNDVAHGIKYNYVELCEIVKVFRAGVYNLADENVGKSITVELRLYEPVAEDIPLTNTNYEGETGNFVTVLTEEYTLGPVQESNKN